MLRQARENAGYSIARAAVATKIAYPFIEALESGKLQELPAEVFGRGFIRNLCKVYDEDPKPLLRAFEEAVAAGTSIEPADADKLQPKVGQNIRLFPSIGLHRKFLFIKSLSWFRLTPTQIVVLSVLILTVVGGAVWWMLRSEMTLGPESTRVTKRQTVENSAPAAGLETAATDPVTAGPTADAESQPESMATGETVASGVSDSEVVDQQAQEDAAFAPDMQWVELQVIEPVKVIIERDDGSRLTETLQPDSYQYRFDDKMMIFVENAAAMEVSYNGRSLGLLGESGTPRRLTFKAISSDD
jgi:cytoskeletal protein RodZ